MTVLSAYYPYFCKAKEGPIINNIGLQKFRHIHEQGSGKRYPEKYTY